MWGFISVINGTLLPHLRSVFELSYFQTGLIESVWFIGYLLASIPAAKLIERIGYQRALTTGLLVMTTGSLGMILAAYLISYPVTVASLFVVSCGIALLQVAANPYVAVIGPPETSEQRLTLVQAFNTTGDVLAVIFGKYLILGRTTAGTAAQGTQLTHAQRMADAHATELPYLIVAIVLGILAFLIARAKLPALGGATARVAAEARRTLSLFNHRNLILGCIGIALCVLAEIGVGSYFVNFVSQPSVANITQEHAATYLIFFWAGMMVGRFAAAALMRRIAPGTRAGDVRAACDRRFACGGIRARPGGDVRTYHRRPRHFAHVSDHFRPRDPRPGTADGGRVRLADHVHRRRRTCIVAGQNRRSLRSALGFPRDRWMCALRALLRAVGLASDCCSRTRKVRSTSLDFGRPPQSLGAPMVKGWVSPAICTTRCSVRSSSLANFSF